MFWSLCPISISKIDMDPLPQHMSIHTTRTAIPEMPVLSPALTNGLLDGQRVASSGNFEKRNLALMADRFGCVNMQKVI